MTVEKENLDDFSMIQKIKHYANKFPKKQSINDFSYKDLWEEVLFRNSKDDFIHSSVDSTDVIVDILSAEFHNKPIVIAQDRIEVEKFVESQSDSEFFSEFSINLKTSGSTGESKLIRQPKKMIYSNLINAINLQKLNQKDSILTVSSLLHSGGIHVQTLPGLYVGATISVRKFIPSVIKNEPYTITHLIPRQASLLIKAFNRNKVNFKSYRLIVCGSDVVTKDIAVFFTTHSKAFIVNYGMTEAGPIIINHLFKSIKDVDAMYSETNQGHFLGTKCWCEYQIIKGELYLRGENVCSDGFLKTKDKVRKINNGFYFDGRLH